MKYEIISKFYHLLEITYFRKKNTSPRTGLVNNLPNSPIDIIELCGGTGVNSSMIAQHKKAANIYCVDQSRGMLEIAKKTKKKYDLSSMHLYLEDATHTHFPAGAFDYVVLSLVLHEVNEDVREALLIEAKRLVKSTGRILIVEWEPPKRFFPKIAFLFIRLMESKDFNLFMKYNFKAYFKQKGLNLIQTRHYDYSCIFELKK